MLVLSRADVEELLDLDELLGALAHAHEELSVGAASMPARIAALAGDAVGVPAGGFCGEPVRVPAVVAAATPSAALIVRLDWVAPGAHVSSVGYNAPGSELDPQLVAAVTVFVEARSSSFAPPPGGAP